MTRVTRPQLPRLFSMFFSMLRWCSANQPAQSPPNPPPTASLNPIRPRKPCESRLRIGCRHCCVCTINNSIGPPTVALGGEQDRGGEGGGGVRSRWRGLGRFGWLLYRSLSSRTAPKPLATQWGSWTRVASLTHAALHPALATTVGPFARLPRVETSIGGGLLLTCVRLRG